MDEECLAKYEAGGMDFNDIGKFDAWLSRGGNFGRILPHDPCRLHAVGADPPSVRGLAPCPEAGER
jgi:hypothetical protein